MFTEAFYKLHPPLTSYTRYPSCKDRSSWEALNVNAKAEFITLGESYLHFSYPALSATDFLDFTRTGNRTRYEDKFFSKRLALSSLVIAECIENRDRFMDDIVNGIFSICEESGWQLPSHNSYIRDMPSLPLPDAQRPLLDLFACETGAILSTTLYLLEEKLDLYSPVIAARIRSELKCRILTPYLSCHFWWMGNGKEPMNNWTIWCTQNILITAFLSGITEDPMPIVEKSCKSIDYFLAEYAMDGCCDEGAQYYRHAGLCLFNTMELLNAVTGDHFLSLYQNTKIKNIASYIMHVHIDDKYYLNYADCSPVAGRAGIREYLFAKRTGNVNMINFAVKDFLAGGKDTMLLSGENNLYYRLQSVFTLNELLSYAKSSLSSVNYQDIYFAGTGIFISRKADLFLAVKAGCNNDSHNHNDTGSFTIYKHGKPLFIDVGVESYTAKTFSDKRYEIWTMQSDYHNLPTIGNIMQKDGAAYRAENISYTLSDTESYIEMELKTAYPEKTGLLSYKRRASLNQKQGICIRDQFSFLPGTRDQSVILNLMTYEVPVISSGDELSCKAEYGTASSFTDELSCSNARGTTYFSGDRLFLKIGTLGSIRITGGSLLAIETIPVTDKRLKNAWEHEIYRIRIQADDSAVEMHIS